MTTTNDEVMTKNEVMKTSEASINDGGPVHPMVMKAARASSDTEAEIYGIDPNLKWEIGKERHIKTAQAALTECGALECLGSLERLRGEWAYQCSKGNVPEGRVEAEMADKAIAKAKAVEVYGSAP
jgi:hypothetical protein